MPTRQEFEQKHALVAEHLQRGDLEAALLARRCSFSWLTCGAHNYVGQTCDVGNSHLLVDRQGAVVLANNIEAPRLADELSTIGIEVVAYDYTDADGLVGAIQERVGSGEIGSDVTVPGLDTQTLGPQFDQLRWRLTDWELQRYRGLCTDVVGAVEHVCRTFSPGCSEHVIAGQTELALRNVGCVSWVLLVGADDRLERFRHPLPTDQLASRRALIAVCAERGGLISACSRVASFEPIDDDLRQRHVACVTVDAALWSRTNAGATLADCFAEAVEAYAATGFADQWRLHHQGGSIGYLPRERKAAPNDMTVALADQPFAWNPSITGVKSEDTILCTASGPTALAAPTDWPTVSADWKGYVVQRPDILVR
jgi:Xaa-Pro aminopeptidase